MRPGDAVAGSVGIGVAVYVERGVPYEHDKECTGRFTLPAPLTGPVSG